MAGSSSVDSLASDVRRSSAWGQLFIGTMLAGFSVYHLALKVANAPISEILKGWLLLYEQVRNVLLMPFDWIHLGLTADEKNLSIVLLVLIGSAIRSFSLERKSLSPFANLAITIAVILFGIALLAYSIFYCSFLQCAVSEPGTTNLTDPNLHRVAALHIRWGFYLLLTLSAWAFVAFPLLSVWLMRGNVVARVSAQILLNLFFSIAWGFTLLLLNWATT